MPDTIEVIRKITADLPVGQARFIAAEFGTLAVRIQNQIGPGVDLKPCNDHLLASLISLLDALS